MRKVANLQNFLWIISLDFAFQSNLVHNVLTLPDIERPFGPIRGNIQETKLAEVIASMTHKDHRKTIVITNEAEKWIRIWCVSASHDTGEYFIFPTGSMVFSSATSVNKISGRKISVWCTLQYRRYWALWNVYDGFSPYVDENEQVYRYVVRIDGVYINGKKIRGLGMGDNHYVLWSHYDQKKKPYGESLVGYVDSDLCNNVPGWMWEKTSVVILCNYQCIILYQQLHCEGVNIKLEAPKRCTDFWLVFFNDKTSSVKGC